MAEEKPKSLEMRVAELEDKLSKIHITEEEMKTYQKVASLVGQGAGGGSALSPQFCIIYRCIINPICIIRPNCIIRPVCECFECGGCGPCAPSGGSGLGGGGFGSFGM
jgi:hypothetical protein